MCVLREHINHQFLKIFYRELKNLSKKLVTSSFSKKKILKKIY